MEETKALGTPVLIFDLNYSSAVSGTDFLTSSAKLNISSSYDVISTNLTRLTSCASIPSLETHSNFPTTTPGTVNSRYETTCTGSNHSTEALWHLDQVDVSSSISFKSVFTTATADTIVSSSSVSTPSSRLSGASKDQEQLYRNAVGSFDIMPGVLRNLVQWVCTEKDADETFMKFLEKEKPVRNWLLKKVGMQKDGLEILETNKDCNTMDVPLLYGLIRACCRDKLADCSDPIWGETRRKNKAKVTEVKLDNVIDNKMDGTRTEYLLKKTYELRNAFCHGDKSAVTSSSWFGDMKATLHKLIFAFGELYSIGSDVIENERARLINEICNLGRKSRVIERIDNFRAEAFREAKSHWKEQRVFDSVPFDEYHLNQKHAFHPIDIPLREILPADSPIDTMPKTLSSYRDILDDPSDTDRIHFTILRGEAGSGKTTVARMIALQFFEVIDREIISLTESDLLYYLECRTHKLGSMKNFVIENFPASHKKCKIEDELDCFRYLRNLIIVDGYDECTESSNDLIIEIVQQIKSMSLCKVIVTSRPHKITSLEDLLVSEKIKFQTFELTEINVEERQLEFLKIFWNSTNHDITAEKVRSLATQNAIHDNLFSRITSEYKYSLLSSDQRTSSNGMSFIGTSGVTCLMTEATKTSNEIALPADSSGDREKSTEIIPKHSSTGSIALLSDTIPKTEIAGGTRNQSDIDIEHGSRAGMDLIPSIDGMIETFQNLNEEVKDFFVRPINLVMFHYLYSASPTTVQNWIHPTDVTRHIMKICENSIANKLEILGLSASTDLGQRLMYEVNQFAFQSLANDQLSLTDMDLEELETNCYEILYENKKVLEFDISVILSVILLVRVAPTPTGRRTYQFFHKSIQELMASQSLLRSLCNDGRSLKVVFLERAGLTQLLYSTASGAAAVEETSSVRRFLNVILFVVMELSADANQELILERRFPEIVEVLKMAKVHFPFWAELVASCPTSDFVAKSTAESCSDKKVCWMMQDSREVSAVSRMLEHDQPGFLSVMLSRSVRTPASLKQLLSVIGRRFGGELRLECEDSYWNHVPLDDYLHNLHNTGSTLTTSSVIRLLTAFLQGPCASHQASTVAEMEVTCHCCCPVAAHTRLSYPTSTSTTCNVTQSTTASHVQNKFLYMEKLVLCQLTRFQGCLAGTREATTALMKCALLCNSGYFFISLAPSRRHQMLLLDCTRHGLWFRARTADFDCSRRRHLMLPHGGGKPPRLTIVCSSKTGVEEIAQLIDSFQPPSGKYLQLSLQNCHLDDNELKKLLKNLVKRSLQTVLRSKRTEWWPAGKNPEDKCFVCEEWEHKPGERCVHLFLKRIMLALPPPPYEPELSSPVATDS